MMRCFGKENILYLCFGKISIPRMSLGSMQQQVVPCFTQRRFWPKRDCCTNLSLCDPNSKEWIVFNGCWSVTQTCFTQFMSTPSARMVLREPGGSSGGQGGGVASHPGTVAGDRGQDCPTNQVWLGKTSFLIQYSYSSDIRRMSSRVLVPLPISTTK